MRFDKFLVPTDLSIAASQAIAAAVDLAKLTRASITLIHLYELPPMVDPSTVTLRGGEHILLRERMKKEAQEQLEHEAESMASKGVSVIHKVCEGQADKTIVEMAEGHDLIIMGTHGRTGLSHLLIGSVAEYVIRHSPIPVLTVRIH